jgi:nicotinate-nucleotide adenylyltransferase
VRIALFGGTFDPPHRGHLAVAAAAADEGQLASVLFAPVGRQPLKLQQASSSFADRLAMVTLACGASADGRFIVSDVDAPRSDGQPNFTVDTLAELAAAFPDASLYNLVGADSFRHLAHWKEPARLLSLAEWIVISRPGFPLHAPDELMLLPQARIHLLSSVQDDTSATSLRARLSVGERCPDLLSPAVERYIRQHGLYGSGPFDAGSTGLPTG